MNSPHGMGEVGSPDAQAPRHAHRRDSASGADTCVLRVGKLLVQAHQVSPGPGRGYALYLPLHVPHLLTRETFRGLATRVPREDKGRGRTDTVSVKSDNGDAAEKEHTDIFAAIGREGGVGSG